MLWKRLYVWSTNSTKIAPPPALGRAQKGNEMMRRRYPLARIQKICPRQMTSGQYLLVFAGMVGLILSPAKAADANRGTELAKRWCASCHVVDEGQRQASTDVPPFSAIAKRSDFSPEKLAFFLLDPHPKMPNFPLSRNEASDIAAYIGSLRN